MLNHSRSVFFCGLLTVVAGVEGCQRGPSGPAWDLAPVEGTVTRAGRPLADIQVIFWPDLKSGTQGPRASAFTDAAGHYKLRTDTGDQGAAIGRYRVCLLEPPPLEWDKPGDKGRPWQAKMPKEKRPDAVQLPPAYSRFAETPLRFEVRPGAQIIDLEVK